MRRPSGRLLSPQLLDPFHFVTGLELHGTFGYAYFIDYISYKHFYQRLTDHYDTAGPSHLAIAGKGAGFNG